MSLLTRPKHSLTVQLYEEVAGSVGQKEFQPVGAEIPVRGNKHPLTAQETEDYGLQNFTTTNWHSTSWPGDQHSRVTLEGAEWDQIGEAKLFDMSERTRHYEVILRKRG